MKDLRGMMLILTIVSIPIIVIYRTGNGINFHLEVKSIYGKWSIANLGFDSVHCTLIAFGFKEQALTCPYGSI